MKKRTNTLLFLLILLALRSTAQFVSWDTIDLHSPLSNILDATRLNQRFFCTHAEGISFSDDYGEHWQPAPGGPERAYHIWTRDGNIYASRVWNGYDSTWVSNDGGASFEYWGDMRCDNPTTKVIRGDTMFIVISGSGLYVERVFQKLRTATEPDILFECPFPHYTMQITEMGNRLIVLCSDGIRWSDDSGRHWTHSGAFTSLEANYRLIPHQNALFLMNNDHQMFRSMDAGETWQPVSFFLSIPYFLRNLVAEGDDLIVTAQGAPFPGPELGQWRSSDLGETWTPVYPQIFGAEINLGSYLTPMGKRFFTNKGCYAILDNDQTWETKNDGLPQDQIAEATRFDKQRWLVASEGNSHLFLTKNHGHDYKLVWHSPYYSIIEVQSFGETVLALSGYSGFLRSDDGGQSWRQDTTPTNSAVLRYCRENQDLLVHLSSGELYRYQIGTSEWKYLSNIGAAITMAFAQGKLYVNGLHGVQVSEDYGNTFDFHQEGLPDFYEGNKLFTLGDKVLSTDLGSGLYLSQNHGVTWTYLPDPADGAPFPPFEDITGTGQVWFAYARFSSKIFFTTDRGINWQTSPIPVQGYGPGAVTFMKQLADSVFVCFQHKGRHYVISQKNDGLFETGDPDDNNNLSFKVAPNPVQNTNAVSLSFPKGIPDNTELTVSLFDPTGHLVLDTRLETFDNQVELRQIPKGLFYVRVRTGDKKGVGIMIRE